MCTILATSNITYAESVSIVNTLNKHFHGKPHSYFSPTEEYRRRLTNPNINIQYNVSLRNTDTGETVKCGSTVPKGTNLELKFVDHGYCDASWVGTGTFWDSPCGTFSANATPSANLCSEKNFLVQELGEGYTFQFKHYVELSVNPPVKTFSRLPSNCTTSSGQAVCSMNTLGANNITFNFNQTYAKFYYGASSATYVANGTYSANYCYKDQAPLSVLADNNIPSDPVLYFYRSGEKQTTGSGYTNVLLQSNMTFPPTPYIYDIPAQQINCTVNVINPDPHPPTPPQLSLDAGGACYVGDASTLTMTSTDADGEGIQYYIDWNNDGTADQVAPPSTFSPSGTPVSANKVFSTPGIKTIRVFAKSASGGLSSATFTTTDCYSRCSQTNVCGQTKDGILQGGTCTIPGVANINDSCISYFSCSSDSVPANGSVECDWQTPDTIRAKCGFWDYTTPTPRPIPGLQNLSKSSDGARITNIQNTTRFCLVCQLYNKLDNTLVGDAIRHQWIKVIRIGEN